MSVSGIKNVLSNSDITTDRNNIADFFGNINMAAEYVLFSIMILLYLLVKNSPIRRELVLYYTSLLILSSYIILTASRSAIVALLSMFILFAYLSKKKIVFFLALALIGINLSFLSNPKKNVIASNIATRKNSANYRLTMWKNAIQLIKKYPMGIGGDNYQFKYLPYRSRISPKEIDRSPHNEFLAFTAEHGLHSFLITILFGLFLLSHILSRIGRTDRNITYCFIVALGIQSFFQFPLENGLTIILILFLSSILLSNYVIEPKPQSTSKNLIFLINKTLSTAVLLLFFLSFIQHDTVFRIRQKLDPHHWQVSKQKIENLIQKNLVTEAIDTAETRLLVMPEDFNVQDQLRFLYHRTKNFEKICHANLLLLKTLGKRSINSNEFNHYCLQTMPYSAFLRVNNQSFHQYLNWHNNSQQSVRN